MAVTYTWTVSDTERNLSDGGITNLHWQCSGQETVGSGDDAVDYFASRYGSASLEYDADADDFISYENVTEANAIAWAQAAAGQSEVEQAIADEINAQKTPTTGNGTPWS